jgi:probable O-glycosylation ligase (exosortase A-associated)
MIYYALLLFFVLEYMRPGSYIPGLNAIRLNSIVPLVVILGTLLTASPVSNQAVLRESNTKIVLFMLGLIVLSVLTADVTMYAFTVFTTVLGYVLMYWVLARQITDLRRLKGLFMTLILIHVALAAMTPQMFTDPDSRYALASGTFLGDGNDYALSVNLAIPFCLFLLFDAKNARHKMICAGALLFLVLCVVATKSRGGTLALGCVGLYYWLKSDKKAVTGLLAAGAVLAILVVAPPTYFERMGTISANPQDGSAQGRLIAWQSGVRMALDNPLLGVGAGMFPAKFGTVYRPPGEEAGGRWKTAHSIYFLILGELGLPGLGLLLTFIFSNLVVNRRLLKELARRPGGTRSTEARLLACLSASVIAYAVAGAFLSAVYYPHMFVLAGLLVAARRIVAERSGTADLTGTAVPSRPAVPVRGIQLPAGNKRAS